MKGTFFSQGLEYSVLIPGERWRQGEKIVGTLTLKNHEIFSQKITTVGIALALATFKDVRTQKKISPFFKLELLEQQTISPGESIALNWVLPIEEDGPFTDDKASPFLLYGNLESEKSTTHIQLNVAPQLLVDSFLDIFCKFFSFVVKHKRFAEGWVEAKLVPPDSTTFKIVDYLICKLRIKQGCFEIQSCFMVKTLNRVQESIEVKNKKVESTLTLKAQDCLIRQSAPHQDFLVKQIELLLQTVKAQVKY